MSSDPVDSEQAKKSVGVGAFEGDDDQIAEFNVPNAQTGERLGGMFLRNVRQPVIDKYRDIRNGDGRRKGDKEAARLYLFKRIFVRFEFDEPGVEVDTTGCKEKTPLGFFLEKCGKLVDALNIQYLEHFYPDIDSHKSS
jgi:hypothetical protein